MSCENLNGNCTPSLGRRGKDSGSARWWMLEFTSLTASLGAGQYPGKWVCVMRKSKERRTATVWLSLARGDGEVLPPGTTQIFTGVMTSKGSLQQWTRSLGRTHLQQCHHVAERSNGSYNQI